MSDSAGTVEVVESAGHLDDAAAEKKIASCLGAIRWRLWTVRVIERMAVGLAWGGGVAVPLVGAWLLRIRFPGWAVAAALVPVAMGVWAWMYGERLRKSGQATGLAGITTQLARIGAVATAVLSVLMVLLVTKVVVVGLPVWGVAATAGAVFLILAAASVRMIPVRLAAIFVDQQVGLRERVATALEMLQTPAESREAAVMEKAFREPVIASAVGACERVKTAKVGYGRLDRRVYAVAATVAIAAGAITLLNPLPAQARTVKKTFVVVQNNAKNLQEVLKEMEQKRLPHDKDTAEKLKPLEQALAQLKEGNMSPIESSALLEQVKKEMERNQEQAAASDKVQNMLKKMEQTQDFAKSNDQMKDAKMQEAQGNANAGSQKAAAEKGMKNAAQTMADKMRGGQMSGKEKADLANELKDAAKEAAGDPQLQKDLQNAADAAEKGDPDALQKNMESAGERMAQQRSSSAMSGESVGRAMAEIDRMTGGAGTQSTMRESGGQGNQGQGQGQQGQGNQGGNQGQGQKGSGGQGSQGEGQGQGQQGQQGQGQGQGNGEGKGNGGRSSEGSSMLEARGGPGDQQQGGEIGRKESFVRIYDQQNVETRGPTEKVGSHIDPLGGPAAGTMQILGDADKGDPTIKTYADVLPDVRQKAMDELERQEIPPQYQDLVKEFYAK